MLRAGVIGCGYFAQNQLAAWDLIDGVTVAAVCDLEPVKAVWSGARSFNDAATMLETETLDFVDIVTTVDSHRPLVELAASHGIPVICQKPLARSMADGQAMAEACERAGVPFMVHENFRFQAPIMKIREVLESGEIGDPTYARIQFRHGHDIYANQPYLRTEPQLAIHDLGIHLIDVARHLLGEIDRLHCRTQRINPEVVGEDCVTMTADHAGGAMSLIDCSFSTKLEPDPFPQTLVRIEGTTGTIELFAGHRLKISGQGRSRHEYVEPPVPAFGDRARHLVQDSVVTIQKHWIDCLKTGSAPSTSARDNLKTLELVFRAYRSAESGQAL
jgi:predicted dehydrogenase